tara:strand:+ start:1383 stop:3008 length:1626 start_codon:yes stop_codon:yes gene_type:complete
MREYLEKNYLNEGTTIKSWLLTLDHKRIGLMYLFAIMFFFAIAGFLALLLRLELLTPAGGDILTDDQYNVFYTLHGAIMIFMFIIPSVPAAMGNLILPVMLGTKDVAFPRLNLASWYIYMVGSFIGVYSIVAGGVDTGWTFYTPYSSSTDTAVISMTFAVFVLGFSSILTGMNFIVTVHKMRTPGLTWFKMPLFIWSLYATALIQILATPVIAVTMLLLIMERSFQIGIFDPAMGGDPVLFQHFFWFYSHPAVYIMILPGMGIISELIATFSKKRIFGYTYIAASSMAIALFGFLVWGHHMFTSQSELAALVFSVITYLTALPSGVKIFNWLATLYKGRISFEAPMLYAIIFLLLFAIGGLTGIFLGTLSVDIMLHDTYFVVAHFHYVMMGGTVIAFLGGLHYWWPKIWGRMYSEKWARVSAILIFFGFNLTFIPQFIMGSQGMPRRYWQYDNMTDTGLFHFYHALSTVGSWMIGIAFIIMLVYLIHSIKNGKVSGSNPWGALTLEWQTPSPTPAHNFLEEPKILHGPYAYDKVEAERTID